MGWGVRARVVPLVVLASMAVAPGAARAAWTDVGGPLDTFSTSLQLPAIATVGGVPYVAETHGTSLLVKHWNGTSWVQDGGALNRNVGSQADQQTIADVGGVPYVAWEEHVSGQQAQLYVSHWNGSAWIPNDDESLNLSSSSSTEPSIADVGGVPFVAFVQESAPGLLDVEHWNGSQWVDDGFTGVTAGDGLFSPSIVGINGVPYVAFQEDTSSAPTIFVEHLSNGNWVQDGGGLNELSGPNDAAFTPTIANVGGVPYVAWVESTGGADQGYVKQWNGSTWLADGGSLSADSGGSISQNMSLLDIGGAPYVASSQIIRSNSVVFVQRWTGANWTTIGSIPAQGQAANAAGALAEVGGVPFLTFAQVTAGGSGGEFDVAALAPDFSSQQAIATDTGALLVARVKDYDTELPVGFQYGPGSSLTSTTASQTTDGVGSSTIVQAISGLSPSSSYSWRAIGLAGASPFAFAPTQTFTTEPANGPGPAGQTGRTGPAGAAGKIELVTCTTQTKTVKRRVHNKLKSVHVKVVSCSTKLVSGPVKFTVATAQAARLVRGKLVYARVELLRNGRRSTLIVTHRVRKLRPGGYTLIAGRARQTVRIR